MNTQHNSDVYLNRFRSSQKLADLGSWDWNIQTGELYWSEQIGPLFGYQPGELETSYDNFLAAVHPDDRQAVINAINASIEQDDPYEIEHRVVWPDGTVRWVLERGDVQRNSAGEPLHMLGIVKDITRRRETELALRESEARFRGLVESTSDWIWEVDPQGRYTYVSPQVERILGYPPASLIGKRPFDLMSASESARMQKAFFTRVNNRQPISHLINTNLHACGRKVILETSGLPFYDNDGRFGGYRGIDRDITDRKVVEQALQEQTLRNRLILENSHDGLIIVSLDGALREVNDAYCRMVGYERRTLLKMTITDLEMIESAQETEEHLRNIVRDGHDHFETSHKGRDGGVVDLDVSATLAKVGEDQFIFAFVRDITERRLREQKRLQEVQAQRDTLVREIHHRIKNHLQGIINLLRNHIREKPELTDALESAIGQVESIALVHGLQSQLNHSRIELVALLEVICKAISHLTSAGIQPVIDCPAMAVIVRPADAIPLALIINELLQNAVKHGAPAEASAAVQVRLMLEKGQVIVQVSNAAALPLPAHFSLQQGVGLGTGLTLARDLLPHQGAELSLMSVAGRVDARLVLECPVVELEARPADQEFSVPN